MHIRQSLLLNDQSVVGKYTGNKNRSERLNNTFRQRITLLGFLTLSFSKKSGKHIVQFGIFFMIKMLDLPPIEGASLHNYHYLFYQQNRIAISFTQLECTLA